MKNFILFLLTVAFFLSIQSVATAQHKIQVNAGILNLDESPELNSDIQFRKLSSHLQINEPLPTLSGGKLSGEFFTGWGMAGIVGLAILLEGGHQEWEEQTFVTGLAISNVAMIPLGVWLIGNIGETTGSYGAAFGGAALGTLIGIGTYYGIKESNSPSLKLLGTSVILIAPALMSVLGFNLTRKWKNDVSSRMNLTVGPQSVGLNFRL